MTNAPPTAAELQDVPINSDAIAKVEKADKDDTATEQEDLDPAHSADSTADLRAAAELVASYSSSRDSKAAAAAEEQPLPMSTSATSLPGSPTNRAASPAPHIEELDSPPQARVRAPLRSQVSMISEEAYEALLLEVATQRAERVSSEASYSKLESQYSRLEGLYETLVKSYRELSGDYENMEAQYNRMKKLYDSMNATHGKVRQELFTLQKEHTKFLKLAGKK